MDIGSVIGNAKVGAEYPLPFFRHVWGLTASVSAKALRLFSPEAATARKYCSVSLSCWLCLTATTCGGHKHAERLVVVCWRHAALCRTI